MATLELALIPTSASSKSAILSIPSNDLDEGIVDVTLSGRGTVPKVPSISLWSSIAMAAVLGLLVVYMVRRRQTAVGE